MCGCGCGCGCGNLYLFSLYFVFLRVFCTHSSYPRSILLMVVLVDSNSDFDPGVRYNVMLMFPLYFGPQREQKCPFPGSSSTSAQAQFSGVSLHILRPVGKLGFHVLWGSQPQRDRQTGTNASGSHSATTVPSYWV